MGSGFNSKVHWTNGTSTLLHGDARDLPLPDESVGCVVTSPPYWGLRDYGLPHSVWGGDAEPEHEWENASYPRRSNDNGTTEKQLSNQGANELDVPVHHLFCPCGAWQGCLGLEPTPELYVQHMVEVFREVWRVLKPTGTVWLNMGDSYANDGKWGGSTGGKYAAVLHGETGIGRQRATTGLKPKDLVGIPWRVAFALQADGWWLRSDIIWSKPNPMPESVTDRPTKSHECVFLLTKGQRYYYDAEAVRERWADGRNGRDGGRAPSQRNRGGRADGFTKPSGIDPSSNGGRNRRSVWDIATQPMDWEMCEACGCIYSGAQYGRLPFVEYRVLNVETEEWGIKAAKQCRRCKGYDAWMSHFATFPEKLVEPCVLAGSSERGVCSECGKPWERLVEKNRHFESGSGRAGHMPVGKNGAGLQGGGETLDVRRGPVVSTITTGWAATCACGAPTVPATVLDPFAGSGTTLLVAQRLGKRAVGVELSEKYLALAQKRLEAVSLPMVLA